jgi:hypothetical protein
VQVKNNYQNYSVDFLRGDVITFYEPAQKSVGTGSLVISSLHCPKNAEEEFHNLTGQQLIFMMK